MKLDHELCRFIIDNIKVPQLCLELNSDSVFLTQEQVGYILGLPTSGPPVPEEGELTDIEVLCQTHGFRGTDMVSLATLERALGAQDAVVDASFKEKLVLFLLATVLCPTTSVNIPVDYLHVVKDIGQVSQYNWAMFVYNKLQDAIIAYKLHGNKAYISGCIYFLQVSTLMSYLELFIPELYYITILSISILLSADTFL